MISVTVTGADALAAYTAVAIPQLKARTTQAVRDFSSMLVERIQTAASGRPGPNIVTGNLYGSMVIDRTIGDADGWGAATVGTGVPYSRRLELGFYGADSLGRVYCVDMRTQALSEHGWRNCDELEVGERILTLNPDTWLSEWQPVQAIHRFKDAEVFCIEARTASICATANHRWLIERYYPRGKRWIREWRTTENMPKNGRIPTGAKCADLPTTKTVDDDVVELAAWFWTEGSYTWSYQRGETGMRSMTQRPIGIRLSQSPKANPGKYDRIVRLLTRMFGAPGAFRDGAHWNVRINGQTGTGLFSVDRVGAWLLENLVTPPKKLLRPDFVSRLTQDQLELLIDVSWMVDGHIFNGTHVLTQADEGRLKSFEMACVLAGHPIRTRPTTGGWGTTLLRTPWSHAFGSALRTDRDHARVERRIEPEVWCPQTGNSTWLARRDGSVYFTGNSQQPYPFFSRAIEGSLDEFLTVMQRAVNGG